LSSRGPGVKQSTRQQRFGRLARDYYGQCTWGTYEKFDEYTGLWPLIGATIVSIASADYAPFGSEPSASAYPSGCGLWVLVIKMGNYAVDSSLTSCNSRPSEIAIIEQNSVYVLSTPDGRVSPLVTVRS